MSNSLYLIPTFIAENNTKTASRHMEHPPLGGRGIVSDDVRNVIAKCDVFIVENLKTARRFIKQIDKEKDIDACLFIELDKHNGYAFNEQELYLLKNKYIGLMSEAGAPCIADPGNKIVKLAHELGWKVTPLVGASSILLALMSSGFNGQHFTFNGYLPIDAKERKNKILELERLANQNITQIFMDTPYRNQKLLDELMQYCNKNTMLCIACNLTADDECIVSQPVGTWKHTKFDIHKKPCIFVLGK
jgi:16S rRNA (cytidine1402-2'-O)-methyltransferase